MKHEQEQGSEAIGTTDAPLTLSAWRERATMAGVAEPVCRLCTRFVGPGPMGRCAKRNEPQYDLGVCLDYDTPEM